MTITEGPFWVEHEYEFEPEAKDRQVRRISYAGLEVAEVRVVERDRTRSRLMTTIGESAKYESASAEAAFLFDSILDTICFNDPLRPENWECTPRLLDCSEYVLDAFGEKRCVGR